MNSINNFKLKSSINKQIKKRAAELPVAPLLDENGMPSFKNTMKRLKGKEITGYDKMQKPLDPNKYYKVRNTEMVMLDHVKEMKKYYKQFGQPGIDEYCKEIIKGVMFIESLKHKQHELKIVN